MPFLSTAQAEVVDRKIDDGEALTGKVTGIAHSETPGVEYAGCNEYDVTNDTDEACSLIFEFEIY
jgi:hypothetical protein